MRQAAGLASDLVAMLPREWRRSPAWRHFQAAQVEFLTGMQFLMQEMLERMKLPAEQDTALKRIKVNK